MKMSFHLEVKNSVLRTLDLSPVSVSSDGAIIVPTFKTYTLRQKFIQSIEEIIDSNCPRTTIYSTDCGPEGGSKVKGKEGNKDVSVTRNHRKYLFKTLVRVNDKNG
jgi:hypothetical protein